MQYDANWPLVEDMQAELVLDDHWLSAKVQEANYADAMIRSADVMLDTKDPIVNIQAAGNSSASAVFDFLLTSPVKTLIGQNADQWQVDQGELGFNLRLDVPISNEDSVSLHVETQIENVSLDMTDLDLAATEVSGRLIVDDQFGMKGDIAGNFFRQPVSASIDTTVTESGYWQTNIKGQGQVDVADIASWFAEPVMQELQGSRIMKGYHVL